jgi:hypothetical protein
VIEKLNAVQRVSQCAHDGISGELFLVADFVIVAKEKPNEGLDTSAACENREEPDHVL